MGKRYFLAIISTVIGVLLLITWLVYGRNAVLLHPQGWVAQQEHNYMLIAVVGMLFLLAIPTLVIMFYIVWKYREEHTKATYTPNLSGKKLWVGMWWIVPAVFACFYSVIVWEAAHRIDPYKPLDSSVKPITVEVVSLDWKWLFIYPEQHIATVNFLEIPVNTPVNFKLTSDAPMNSFWIPALSGQIYSMPAMQTQIHMIGNTIGDFQGRAAEINGSGLAGMTFITRVSSQADFEKWVMSTKQATNPLTFSVYNQLAKPSEDVAPIYYSSVDKGLYNEVLMKDMIPPSPTGMQMDMQNGKMDNMNMDDNSMPGMKM